MQVRTPAKLLRLVWPLPRSLATTDGISVDVSSSPYLDVSVQAVPLVQLWIHCTIPLAWWVAPFRNLRIKAHLQLPEAYRSLSRLSSAPDAKAFPLYSLKLDLVGVGSVSLGYLSVTSKVPFVWSPIFGSQIEVRIMQASFAV